MAVREQLDRLRWPVAIVVATLAALAFAAPAPAATINVTGRLDRINNDAVCSLREAVIAADVDGPVLGCAGGSGDDVILLPPGTYPLTIPASATAFDAGTGSLDVIDPQGSDLTITSYLGLAVIDASAIADRAITARSSLDLNQILVTGGDSTSSPEGPADGAVAGAGGAVATFGTTPTPTLTLRRSLLSGNTAGSAGGAIYASGPLNVANSTLTGNSVDSTSGGGGGAINATGATTTITRSTVAANTVVSDDDTATGGGLRYSAPTAVTGSIIADNSADGGDADCVSAGGSGSSGGFNVIENAGGGCGIALVGSDQQADPGLLPLADAGGVTPTMAIDPSSPAADVGPTAGAACNGTDQRGAPRGVVESGSCDAGAYEITYCTFYPANVIGTTGNDSLHGSRPQVYAVGLGGRDSLFGDAGDDALCGGAGIDMLQGGAGADILLGGPDVDITSYRDASSPVSVVLDNAANDGRAGEGDVVQTESVIGGSAADELRGNGVPNGIQGGPGNDRIDGVAGNDSVLGGPGDDVVNGNVGNDQVRGDAGDDTLIGLDGNDRLEGGDDNDRLDGGPGNDQLFGGEGTNKLLGGDGNDVLTGGLGKDVFKCGAGRDSAIASDKDKVGRDCEKVFGKDAGRVGNGKSGKSARALLADPGAPVR